MKIGVLSDTHGYFDPRLPALFAGVDHILHAGDIGRYDIITELEQIAPVTAVLGNNDYELTLRETEIVTLGSRKFLLHHIVDPAHPALGFRDLLAREIPAVVVFGHTHKTFENTFGPTLFLNPGYAGRTRFNQPRNVARLTLTPARLELQFLAL